MNEEYGKRAGLALQAVRRLHSDTRILLRDCGDKLYNGWESVFGNNVTRDMTQSIDGWTDFWMAEGLYRHFTKKEMGSIVEALTVCFIDAKGRNAEPLMILSQIRYRLGDRADVKSVCGWWDGWHAYLDAKDVERQLGVVLAPKEFKGNKDIEWARVLAVPLYSINSVDDVERLMQRVREASP